MENLATKDALRKSLKNSHITGQHCQRNFDLNKKMPDADIETIIHAATQCPSKQNLDFYSVYAIQDRNIIEKLYNLTQTARGRKNPQVLGQLLLVFVSNPDVVSFNDRNDHSRNFHDKKPEKNGALSELVVDMHQAIGVAAGFVNVTSSMLGYRCGCNRCFDPAGIQEVLGLADDQMPVLMMGVGIKDDNRNRREEHYTGTMVDTFKKIPIQVHRV